MECRGCGYDYANDPDDDGLMCVSISDVIVDRLTKEPLVQACAHCLGKAKHVPKSAPAETQVAT